MCGENCYTSAKCFLKCWEKCALSVWVVVAPMESTSETHVVPVSGTGPAMLSCSASLDLPIHSCAKFDGLKYGLVCDTAGLFESRTWLRDRSEILARRQGTSSGDRVDNEKDNSSQEINHRVHEQEPVLVDTTPVVSQKRPISVDMHAIERARDNVNESLEVFDGTTIVHEEALRDATPIVGQNRPEDIGMHAIEQACDDVTESPDVMNYHTGVPDAGDSRSLSDADPQIRQFDWT